MACLIHFSLYIYLFNVTLTLKMFSYIVYFPQSEFLLGNSKLLLVFGRDREEGPASFLSYPCCVGGVVAW